jgi:hypothetical protein
MIGDPLYRPYAHAAPLKVDDLPAPLQTVVQKIEAQTASDR